MSENLITKLEGLKEEALQAFSHCQSEGELYHCRVRFLGKKGILTEILKELGNLSPEERPRIGAYANQVKLILEQSYEGRLSSLKQSGIEKALEAEAIDTTLPGVSFPAGRVHPISRVLGEMKAVFRELGFDIAEGPEIETDYYNFEALNIPANHPARDMQDTFFLGAPIGKVKGGHPPSPRLRRTGIGSPLLLRTHTSPVQIRFMEKRRPPIQMVAPGVVYRRDSDVSHSPMFHQVEGLMVDRHITLAHLKGVVELLLQKIFRQGIRIKFRPSFFPFTEPSAEVDITCVICGGRGCRVCKKSGYLEIMGCGMVHPEVFRHVRIDPEKYTGFAFGLGVERVAMLKYGIDDIRLFFENDVKFLEQF